MESELARTTIGAILKHDRKVTSYKFALIRAINDVTLSFPTLTAQHELVAIPLRMLAEWWVAYYWPFVQPHYPLLQGTPATTATGRKSDMAFRGALTQLRNACEMASGTLAPSDGFYIRSEMLIPRRRDRYSPEVKAAYAGAVRAIMKTLEMPIRYAGPAGQQWSVFPKPCRLAQVSQPVTAVPGAKLQDICLLVTRELWYAFQELSLWIEALCVHEWCLFTERLEQEHAGLVDRGAIFVLLTARPDRRQDLTWERNGITLLLQEGATFTCPWTQRTFDQHSAFDLDHIVPLALYPTNELWNLVPADPTFNQHTKRDRLPSASALQRAMPHLLQTYRHYLQSQPLRSALQDDVRGRFDALDSDGTLTPSLLTETVITFVDQVATYRNTARF